MTGQQILYLYLAFFAFEFCFSLFLDWLNIKHVRSNRDSIPEDFKEYVDQETYSKSVDYTLTKARFGLVSGFYSSALLLVFILSGFFGFLDNYWQSALPENTYSQGVLVLFSFGLINSILSLPFSLYSTFVIEERFGFNKMTPGLWVKDALKGFVISIIFMAPLLYGLFWFMDSTGEYWWLYAFGFITVFQLLVMYIYPAWIAPWFNKFAPLEDGNLKKAIETLAESISYRMAGVFKMDGSKRSSHGNAYFTGFGKNKRIVLFDTLINSLSVSQVVAVLAHEMGHQKKNHIKKLLSFSLLFMLAGFWLLSLLIGYLPFFEAFGFERISYHGALIVFAFASGPLSFFISPLMSVLSRRFEYQADSFAVEAVKNSEDLSTALLELSKKNLSNFTPHPWYSFFHYSHPTLAERLKAMRL